MIKNFLNTIVFMLATFVGTSLALAQTNTELADLVKPVLDAVMSGQYMYAVPLALVLGVALLRRFGGARWPVLASAKVAPLLAVFGAFAATMAAALSTGASIDGHMVWTALTLVGASTAGYALLKPLLKPLIGKLPSWAAAPLMLIFDTRSRAETAKAAGDAAVESKPSKGMPVDFKDVP